MESWVAGTTVRMEATIRDALSNELVDPTAVVCRLLSPESGTQIELEATRMGTGVYAAEFIPQEHGVWTYRFEGTGTVSTAGESSFFIRPSSVAV